MTNPTNLQIHALEVSREKKKKLPFLDVKYKNDLQAMGLKGTIAEENKVFL